MADIGILWATLVTLFLEYSECQNFISYWRNSKSSLGSIKTQTWLFIMCRKLERQLLNYYLLQLGSTRLCQSCLYSVFLRMERKGLLTKLSYIYTHGTGRVNPPPSHQPQVRSGDFYGIFPLGHARYSLSGVLRVPEFIFKLEEH